MACILPLAFFLVEKEDKSRIPEHEKIIGSAIMIVAQLAVALWIWSVWTWRFNRKTSFRGVGAESLQQEIATYGRAFSTNSTYFGPMQTIFGEKVTDLQVLTLVGTVKLAAATLVLVSIFTAQAWQLYLSSGILLVLMCLAVFSHVYVGDPMVRSVPALTMAILNALILCGEANGCNAVSSDGDDNPTGDDSGSASLASVFAVDLVSPPGRCVCGGAALAAVVFMLVRAYQAGVYSEVFNKMGEPLLSSKTGRSGSV